MDPIYKIAVISAVAVSAVAEMEPAKPEMWRMSSWSERSSAQEGAVL